MGGFYICEKKVRQLKEKTDTVLADEVITRLSLTVATLTQQLVIAQVHRDELAKELNQYKQKKGKEG